MYRYLANLIGNSGGLFSVEKRGLECAVDAYTESSGLSSFRYELEDTKHVEKGD